MYAPVQRGPQGKNHNGKDETRQGKALAKTRDEIA